MKQTKLLHLLALLDKKTCITIYDEHLQCVIFNSHVEDVPVDICVTRYFVTKVLVQRYRSIAYLTINVRE